MNKTTKKAKKPKKQCFLVASLPLLHFLLLSSLFHFQLIALLTGNRQSNNQRNKLLKVHKTITVGVQVFHDLVYSSRIFLTLCLKKRVCEDTSATVRLHKRWHSIGLQCVNDAQRDCTFMFWSHLTLRKLESSASISCLRFCRVSEPSLA